jgi:H+/Cl- antiporter ClcA
MAASCAAILKLPLSCVIITLALTSRSGLGVSPLIVVAVVVGYLTIQSLEALRATVKPSATREESVARST